MLEAVVAASPQADRPNQEFAREFYRTMLETALGWLVENPILPGPKDLKEIKSQVKPYFGWDQLYMQVLELWQQRMFVVQQSNDEMDFEGIQDLLVKDCSEYGEAFADGLNENIREAYRRGQKASGNGGESVLFSASPDSGKVCNECVVQRITREGSYFPCALPKGHDGGHRAAGTCHKHGRYYGKVGKVPRCPQFPDCA